MAYVARLMPKASTLYWLTLSPSSKAWSWSLVPFHAEGIAAAAVRTSFLSCLPWLVIVPTTCMSAVAGSPSSVIALRAARWPLGETPSDFGLNLSRWPQLGASQGATASSLHRGPSAGTWLARASRGEILALGPALGLTMGTGLGRSSGLGLCQGAPSRHKSCDSFGSLYRRRAEVFVSIVSLMCIGKIRRCSCSAS